MTPNEIQSLRPEEACREINIIKRNQQQEEFLFPKHEQSLLSELKKAGVELSLNTCKKSIFGYYRLTACRGQNERIEAIGAISPYATARVWLMAYHAGWLT